MASITRPPSTSATMRPSEMQMSLNDAIDAIRGIVDLATRDSQHRISVRLAAALPRGVQCFVKPKD